MAKRLNDYERLTLINQFRILEALYPDDADGYAKSREILENEYEANYEMHVFSLASNPISEREGKEVKDTLQMFKYIEEAMPEDFPAEMYPYPRFQGYSPEDGREFIKFARFAVERMGIPNNFPKIESWESPVPTREAYRIMHREWDKLSSREMFNMSLPQLKNVLNSPNVPVGGL